MADHKKQHTDEQSANDTPEPFSPFSLFKKNLDVYRKIAKGFRLPIKEVSREMRDLESYQNIDVQVNIPSVENCPPAQNLLNPLFHKFSVVHKRLGELRSPKYKIVSLTCDCDKQRVKKIIIEDFRHPVINPVFEMRNHYSTMREIADFVQVQKNLTSVTLANLFMTNITARILGDMLRNSGVITTLRLRNLDFDRNFPQEESDWGHFFQHGSSLTELEVSHSDIRERISEPYHDNPLRLLSSATNLTTLTLNDNQICHMAVNDILAQKEQYDLRKLPRLKTLYLANNEVESLKGYPDCPDLCPNEIGILAQLQSLTQLETLILLDNYFEEEEVNLFHNTYVNSGKTLLKLSRAAQADEA